jgi:predicted DNA-binding transcriptional regulator YafY
MYQPTTRLLTVLELLQARPHLTGAELARRLEVDGRTVRRYVTMLQDAGIPVEAMHGRYGGYRLRPGFKLPPLMFSEEEALAVTLGLMAARRLGLAGAAPATEGALAKIERVLPVIVRERISALEATIGFTQRAPHVVPAASDVLLTLSAAAHHQRRVHVQYRARDGAESERDVDPYGLVFHYGRWYLVGHDHASSEIRTFRIDRVLLVELRDGGFERPPQFDAVDHLAKALASLPFGFEIEVRLDTTVEEARSRVPAFVAGIEETPDGVMLRTQTEDPGMAARYLVGLGFRFTVIRPPELQEAVRRLAAELLGIAEPVTPYG